jgi:hypothetical protein
MVLKIVDQEMTVILWIIILTCKPKAAQENLRDSLISKLQISANNIIYKHVLQHPRVLPPHQGQIRVRPQMRFVYGRYPLILFSARHSVEFSPFRAQIMSRVPFP